MEKGKQGKGVKAIIAVAIVVIAGMAGVIVYLLQSRGSETPEPMQIQDNNGERRGIVLSSENVDEVLEAIEQQAEIEAVAPGYYTVTMPTTWHFHSGAEPSYDAVVENVEGNTNDVYFDIVLESDEDVILYQSPVLPRGTRLREIALDQVLEKGTYPTVMIYHLIDEDQNTLSTVRVTVQMVIES